jgi:hypothetical protein
LCAPRSRAAGPTRIEGQLVRSADRQNPFGAVDDPNGLLDLEFKDLPCTQHIGPHSLTKDEGEKPFALATVPLKSAQR